MKYYSLLYIFMLVIQLILSVSPPSTMNFTTKIIITSFFIYLFSINLFDIYAYNNKEWNLPWVNIIKRENWINDSSILYKKQTTENNITINTDTDDTDIITSPTTLTKTQTINSYLSTVFPEQVLLNGIIRQINWQDLIRSRWYKTQKTHIVVHHTVNDLNNIKTPEQAKSVANSIFRYHTVTNGWGDIGYNFIIDPWGNIYEGRWWGEGIVGAHAKFNNASSIGIALMGNFEINEPTSAQIAALTQLSTAVMIRYRINPDSEVYSHIEDHNHPYVKDIITDAFIGHRDTGITACPGKNLYNKLPQIQQAIRANLITQNKLSSRKTVRRVQYIKDTYTLIKDQETINIPVISSAPISRCSTTTKNVKVSCTQPNNSSINLTISKRRPTQIWSGPVSINITTKGTNPNIKAVINVLWTSDQKLSMEKRKSNYITKNNIALATNLSNKFNEQITISDIKQYVRNNVNVLLYEASTTLPEWKILCQNCIVKDDKWMIYTDNSFTITNQGSSLIYSSRTQYTTIQSISITPKRENGTTFITNYGRTSYAGIAWNHFYGTVTISQQPIKLLDQNNITNQYVVTNSLPFDLYLRGIVESNDTEPTEKIKAMTLLVKNYILFYSNPSHRHPSIPVNATYNAVDDARIFQKYVGAGVDSTLTKWKDALEITKNQVITYEDNLAFLPYFSCSAWFTWSATEKYGRKDTPYLVSVYDPNPCNDFNGHGVGLAGNGATYMANNKSNYKDIINYFYPGTTISTY